jgi:hypothetical protein
VRMQGNLLSCVALSAVKRLSYQRVAVSSASL